jgi:hypothetical protein
MSKFTSPGKAADALGAHVAMIWRVDGVSCLEADAAYQCELLVDLFYPLADALVLRGVPPARIESIISQGLEGMAEALGQMDVKRD